MLLWAADAVQLKLRHNINNGPPLETELLMVHQEFIGNMLSNAFNFITFGLF